MLLEGLEVDYLIFVGVDYSRGCKVFLWMQVFFGLGENFVPSPTNIKCSAPYVMDWRGVKTYLKA